MNAKISIIIPVYNCAPYLEECIDSVLSEKNLYDIEVLLIDDGSTDGSEKICDKFASAYSQVRVIHTGNRGVSCARNRGIEEATGEWIMFVDGDDVLKPNALSVLDKQVEFYNYDITRFESYRCGNGMETPIHNRYSNDVNEHRNLVVARDAMMAVWGAIYSRHLFMRHSIRFNKGVRTGEDWVVLFKLLCHAKKFHYCCENLYGYRINPNSAIHRRINYVRPDTMIALNLILEYAKEHKIFIPQRSVFKAKSDLRRGCMKKAVIYNSKDFYAETERLMARYIPQSFWKDVCYCNKPKHILVFIAYQFTSYWYKTLGHIT